MEHVLSILSLLVNCGIAIYILQAKSYLAEKAKNQASKEDLKQITEIVENARSTFTEQTEILKSQLNLLTNIQTALKNEERIAIVDFNEKYFIWLNLLLNAGSVMDLKSTATKINQVKSEISIGRTNLEISYARLTLYLDDPEIIEKASGLHLHTLVALPLQTTIFLSELEYNLIKIQTEGTNFEELQEKSRLTDLQIDRFKVHWETILKDYKPISDRFREFQTLCRVYLNKSI